MLRKIRLGPWISLSKLVNFLNYFKTLADILIMMSRGKFPDLGPDGYQLLEPIIIIIMQ